MPPLKLSKSWCHYCCLYFCFHWSLLTFEINAWNWILNPGSTYSTISPVQQNFETLIKMEKKRKNKNWNRLGLNANPSNKRPLYSFGVLMWISHPAQPLPLLAVLLLRYRRCHFLSVWWGISETVCKTQWKHKQSLVVQKGIWVEVDSWLPLRWSKPSNQ